MNGGVDADGLENYKTTRCGRMQRVWKIHESPVAETVAGPWGELEFRWALRVYNDGTVQTSRCIPYSGQRYYSTEDRPNRADKSSQYRLTIKAVLDRHATACGKRGGEVLVADLRERVLAVLRRGDVATNNNDGEVGLLADGRGE